MGLLTAGQEMQWFVEVVLKTFTSTIIFEYQDVQGHSKGHLGRMLVTLMTLVWCSLGLGRSMKFFFYVF
jgi:hypothetical protein